MRRSNSPRSGRAVFQMEMVADQTPGVDLPVRLGTSFPQSFQEEFTIAAAAEDRFPMVSATHQMIDRPFILGSKLSCHGGDSTPFRRCCQYSDPFDDPPSPRAMPIAATLPVGPDSLRFASSTSASGGLKTASCEEARTAACLGAGTRHPWLLPLTGSRQ